jgi:2-polyprenyl-6-methoxyphenol hydroxylase-like FAD-dependent oxidoreductase
MHFVEMMYDTQPNKSKAKVGKCVRVKLDDGTFEAGDIVIGADGAHSSVRKLMWEHENAKPSVKGAMKRKC